MLLGRNRSGLCCCAVATVTLLIAHWLSSGAGFLSFILYWCFQTGYGIPPTFSGPVSKTTAAVGVLGKEAVPVNDTFPSAWYPTSCFPAKYSSRRQGRQKHLSWDATVPFKSSKSQNFLYAFSSLLLFNTEYSFFNHISHANTLASKYLLYSHVFMPSLWLVSLTLFILLIFLWRRILWEQWPPCFGRFY